MELAPIIKDNFLVFSDDLSLSQVAGKLQDNEKRCGLVFRNKKYLGLVEKRKLLHPSWDLSETKVDHAMVRTPILAHSTTNVEAARLFSASNAEYLPVEQDKEIVGVVSAINVTKALVDLPEAKKLLVSNVKLFKPVKLTTCDSMATAITMMLESGVDSLPVFNEGSFEGVILYKDVIRRYLNWTPQRNNSAKFNAELRTKAAKVDTVSLGDVPLESFVAEKISHIVSLQSSLADALIKMKEMKTSELYVEDQGKYLGVLTVKNVLNTVNSQTEKNFDIKFIGLGDVDLTEHQRDLMDRITQREAEKLQRKLGDNFTMTLHVKQIRAEGKQRSFEVKLKVDHNGQLSSTSKEDWDFETALHKCFNMLH